MLATIQEALKRNLLLFEKPKQYLLVTAYRLAALFLLVMTVKFAISWDGSVPELDILYVISVLLALFSVGLSCAFYLAANQAARDSQGQLQKFLTDMRAEFRRKFSDMKLDLMQSPTLIEDLERKVQNVQAHPDSEEPKFELLTSLLEPCHIQLLILVHEKGIPLLNEPWQNFGFRTAQEDGRFSCGTTSVSDFCKKLADTGLLRQDMHNTVTLTELGHNFAEWLRKKGKKALYFETDFGKWGEPPEELKQFQAQHPNFGVFPQARWPGSPVQPMPSPRPPEPTPSPSPPQSVPSPVAKSEADGFLRPTGGA